MRELTIRIRFNTPSLGNVRSDGGRLRMPRGPAGTVMFLPTWHLANMKWAATTDNRHQAEVASICWDPAVDGQLHEDCWFRRYYSTSGGRTRYALHESFRAGQEIGVNCVVPGTIGDEDLWRLMDLAGRYRGLSPYRSSDFGNFGFYGVVSIWPRRMHADGK